MPGWIGWTVGYALVVWGVDALLALLEPWLKTANRRVQDFAETVRFLLPLVLAFLIGCWLRAWWWVLSPLVVLALPMLAFATADYLKRTPAQRQQAYAALMIGLGVTSFNAGAAAFAAFVGVVLGRVWPGG